MGGENGVVTYGWRKWVCETPMFIQWSHPDVFACITATCSSPNSSLTGDLDPSVSRHHITTMKAAYLKLRQLIDAGCCFVGHWLKKDFEMINVVIPEAQVLDTVDLFYIPGLRRLSLRFLAHYVCNITMANRLNDTHDSIEDARTALAIYNKYLELKKAGTLQAITNELYDIGRETGWEIP